MSGIVGIAQPGKREIVSGMLDKIKYRGKVGCEIVEHNSATFGLVWTVPQSNSIHRLKKEKTVEDEAESGHFASAGIKDKELILIRDELGVAPLYYGFSEEETLCFSSEAKALLDLCSDIKEIPPGTEYKGNRKGRIQTKTYFKLGKQSFVDDPPEVIAKKLKEKLRSSVMKRIAMGGKVGSWLSGGLDSSAMAALACPYTGKLDTFAAGLSGAPDLDHAREVADFIKSEHHEVIVNFEDLLTVLPDVIYHLESFDALLVRSSITNYLVAKRASEYVDAVFSGEGGDELFAGYEYLKSLESEMLDEELIDITDRLHNTALQRVDRSASAHGTVAHVGFLDPDVVDYALRIPAKYKLRESVEKWILRRAMDGLLPERVLSRKKAKFWEGAGIMELISDYADKNISESDFVKERILPNGWIINTKEELMYYRIFKDHFGELEDLAWMGRTKGAPRK